MGFLDQRLALSWVQRNIGAFGGDPGKVTVAGDSSGAGSVDRLVNSMASMPPFRAAITLSGQATAAVFGRNTGPASWKALVAALNCTAAASPLRCVQVTNATTIRAVVNTKNLDFGPVNDGYTQIPLPFIDQRALGMAAKVPYMTGTLAQEGNSYAPSEGVAPSLVNDQVLYEMLNISMAGNQDFIQIFLGIVKEYQVQGMPLFDAASQVLTEMVWQCVRLPAA